MSQGEAHHDCDVLVVGAGSAGCAVAGRLSEDPSCKVILVEAGTSDRVGLSRVPAAVVRTIGNPRHDWRLQTEPDPTRDNRADVLPRGRMLGGSSAINGMIHIRGSAADYDAWAALGNPGWSWTDVQPLFRRLEARAGQGNQSAGELGPQPVSGLGYRYPFTEPFLQACAAEGIETVEGFVSGARAGMALADASIRRGLRVSSYDAYIRPNLKRGNLQVIDGAHATALRFDGRRVTGLDMMRHGQPERISARQGVVLCLGSIATPQLLMLSGIGPAHVLKELGIEVRADRKEVGANLRDHAGFRLRLEIEGFTANQQARGARAAYHLLQWALGGGAGPVGTVSAQAVGFARSQPGLAQPDLQLTLFPYANDVGPTGRAVLPNRALMSIGVNINHPESRGQIGLHSADPLTPPKIDFRLMDDPADVQSLLNGLDLARRISAQPPFADLVLDRGACPPDGSDREADLAWLRETTRSFMHPVGTCRMGSDPDAIVSPDLELAGCDRLWVADASIFPRHTMGNINATVQMIGEKAADLVRSRLSASAG
ncbi:GMC family oxidoreductase [Sagittula stellata]|uniref:Glucose-methanol-choline oxidoreductase n=1 Tax=Sagittula stellata (strain ATCC 700073 / DSM 11524 / E-37) TaxID=388399 RepID=A3K496_SAGS3|nr:GMC family oxidoreductase N-terminal domain-containing protein [Sagittula stellata]EBA07795.1 Glucose-methanol-choline oxidoreductase [Sagittula stellata E-37]